MLGSLKSTWKYTILHKRHFRFSTQTQVYWLIVSCRHLNYDILFRIWQQTSSSSVRSPYKVKLTVACWSSWKENLTRHEALILNIFGNYASARCLSPILHPMIQWERKYETLQWCHNERNSVKSPAYGLFAQPFVRAQTKENVKACVTGHCEWNPPVTGGFTSQRASNAENVSFWWSRHD